MRGPTHIVLAAGSAAAGAWLLSTTGVPVSLADAGAAVIAAGFGAIGPDIDTRSSTISAGIPSRLFGLAMKVACIGLAIFALYALGDGASLASLHPFAGLLGWGVLAFLGWASIRCLAWLVGAVWGHRGATHSIAFGLLAVVFVTALCQGFGVPAWYGLAFGWGWLTHLFADSLTPAGLRQLGWPFVASRGSHTGHARLSAGSSILRLAGALLALAVAAAMLAGLGITSGRVVRERGVSLASDAWNRAERLAPHPTRTFLARRYVVPLRDGAGELLGYPHHR